jgi:hypothetical protein
MLAALLVAWTHAVNAPERCASLSASRATRDLPTPAYAYSTTPLAPVARACAIVANSRSRPTTGQVSVGPNNGAVGGELNTPAGNYIRPI